MSYYVHDYFLSGPQIPTNVNQKDRIFVICVWECVIPTEQFLQQFYDRNNPVTLVLNTWTQHLYVDSRFDCFYIDFFLWRTYNEIIIKQKCLTNPHWNSRSQEFLFLTGKPEKPHRIGLLYKLEQAGLTARAKTSLFVNEFNRDRCRSLLPLTDAEFDLFASRFDHSPDFIWIKPDHSIHYGGIPYDPNIFSCKFRLISETYNNLSQPWITEKTWITVVNRMPFIIAGDSNSCERLTIQGYSTFESALVCQYDHLSQWDQREHAIIQNVAHWLDSDYDFESEVEHNYATFCQQAKSILQSWQQYCEKININIDIDKVIDTRDPQS